MKYLLSTGETTTSTEKYLLDLIKLNMMIYPNDIPNSNIGFDFILTDIKKSNILEEIKSRMDGLVRKIGSRFNSVKMEVTSVELLSEEKARVTIEIGNLKDSIEIEI